MSLKDNPLVNNEKKMIGAVYKQKAKDLRNKDNACFGGTQAFGMFLLNSLWSGIVMVVAVLLLIFGFAVIVAALLGTPILAATAFEQGQYVLGSGLSVLTLIFYGMGFNLS